MPPIDRGDAGLFIIMRKILYIGLACMLAVASCGGKIDRRALVERNDPHIDRIDSLYSLTLGNGKFAMTVDATGLQTFPEIYRNGLSLGTYSQWGWHSFPNTEKYSFDEVLEDHPLPGHPHGIYAVQTGLGRTAREQAAAEWFRSNPHRLHLGNVGFAGMDAGDISSIDQTLDMWNGVLRSSFDWKGSKVEVESVCGGEETDGFAAKVKSSSPIPIVISFPYPTGVHSDDASNWEADSLHSTEILWDEDGSALLRREIDSTVYYVSLSWEGGATLAKDGTNRVLLTPKDGEWSFSVQFHENEPSVGAMAFSGMKDSAGRMWNNYWRTSGVIDFSHCTDPRAALLERRVVLSQYLMRVQEAQDYPPAETGLTYNTWFGKYHLEMVMWHSFHYALWNHPELLEKQLEWYLTAMDGASQIARRQGSGGVRWMKMTDPSALEAPSDVGSFIIWQQPHPIFMCELIYRAKPDKAFLEKYYDMVQKTAEFMGDFVTYDEAHDRYIIEGACAANESYDEDSTLNPAFELAYWYYGLSVAQTWRERMGQPRNGKWDEILAKLSHLSTSPDGIYLPAEKGPGIPDFTNGIPASALPEAPAGGFINGQRPSTGATEVTAGLQRTAQDRFDPFYVKATSSENLLAYGMLPYSPLIDIDTMDRTLDRAAENWGWKGGSWSWNYPSLAMNATRLYRSDVAIRAITMDNRCDLLLPSGNNYRSDRLRMYLPGNGGLLLAVGMMCAGWDGCTEENPGFPKDGGWDVRWEGLLPMP